VIADKLIVQKRASAAQFEGNLRICSASEESRELKKGANGEIRDKQARFLLSILNRI
jgi:hypothetical protein